MLFAGLWLDQIRQIGSDASKNFILPACIVSISIFTDILPPCFRRAPRKNVPNRSVLWRNELDGELAGSHASRRAP